MKWKYLVGAVSCFIIGVILSHTYRPYIYANNIFDFHIADTIGSLVAVPAATFLGLFWYSGKLSLEKIVSVSVLVYVLFEFLGLFRLHGVFDCYDIIACVISGILTYIILNYARKTNL